MTARSFESGPAKRERTHVAIGIVGPSGSGKTKSALRLADGMARVSGGETWLIDTNNRRSLHHAEDHRFNVVHMPPPYSPNDYADAVEHAIKGGARRLIIDSISDEWEGEGGVLDMHADELELKSKGNSGELKSKGNSGDRDRHNMSAWIQPKRHHNRFRLWLFAQPVDLILTFRAKEKIKPVKGGQPEDLGWQPLGAEDLIYELLLKCLLRPQSDGRPVWTSDVIHEKALIKLPGWFRDLFTSGAQLDEGIGEKLAQWAAGGVPAPARAAQPSSRPAAQPAGSAAAQQSRPTFAERFDSAEFADIKPIGAELRAAWKNLSAEVRDAGLAAEARAVALAKRAQAAGMTMSEMREIDRIEREENRA
jgi:hypothetical protein